MQSSLLARLRPKHWAAAAALVVISGTVLAQVTTISVNVKVVNVLATVRDKRGNIVNTLTKDDLTLEEDGRPQAIRYFTRQTDMPLTLGLLVDTSASQTRVLDEERNASAAFTTDVLRADKDSAFLIQFAREVELLQDVTQSPVKVQDSLSRVKMDDGGGRSNPGGGYPGGGGNGGGGYPGGGGGYPGGGSGGGGGYPGGGSHGGGRRGGGSHGGGTAGGGGTLLYDSVFLASDEMMQKQKGRKALVILTDGVDHGSKMSLEQAIESAQRADTMVYSIYFTGDEDTGGGWQHGGRMGGGGWPGGGSPRQQEDVDGKKILQQLSKETGGRMFVVSKKEPITQIYAQIQDELRNQYNIGYTPDRSTENSSDYRHIHVVAKQKDLTVYAREGYYGSQQLDEKQTQ